MSRRRRQRLPREPVVLDIEKLSHEGRGIAHVDGKVVFVEEALPGEQVSALYTSRRDAFDQAKTAQVITASEQRVEPPCEYASICGGCSLQHFESKAQLAFKAGVLHELLQHSLADKDYQHLPPLEGPLFGYRRKARLAVRYVHKKDSVLIGFREKGSSFITDMNSCSVLDQRVSRLLPGLRELIHSLEGFRQIPQIEVAAGDAQDGVDELALVFRNLQPLAENDLQALTEFARSEGFALYLQPGGPESVEKHFPEDGADRLYYRLPEYELELAFHPMDFTQVNAVINRKMIPMALDLLELEREDAMLDLFCGLGNFSLPAARIAASVFGVEGSEAMVKRAEENARRMQVENTDFASADLTASDANWPWKGRAFSKVLLDPPRSGAIEILPEVAKLQPRRIVYVSCNPATLVRDAECLQELGYKLEAAGVMDMFPQTTHVESIALFLPDKKRH